MPPLPFRFAIAALVTVALALPASGQRVVGTVEAGPVPDPVVLPSEGLFQTRLATVGDELFIAGQPTEAALRDLRTKGVTTVINLRMPEEMAKVGFDEAAVVKELGLTYVRIPMRGTKENPYGPAELARFATALASARGKVLLHCTVAWRASHLWAAHLIQNRKVPVSTALGQARAINLRDDQPFGDQQPIEGFLARPVPELAQPQP
jgi:uncharacterized protein (TIGR01244 family)